MQPGTSESQWVIYGAVVQVDSCYALALSLDYGYALTLASAQAALTSTITQTETTQLATCLCQGLLGGLSFIRACAG